jgi:hypothetical protein
MKRARTAPAKSEEVHNNNSQAVNTPEETTPAVLDQHTRVPLSPLNRIHVEKRKKRNGKRYDEAEKDREVALKRFDKKSQVFHKKLFVLTDLLVLFFSAQTSNSERRDLQPWRKLFNSNSHSPATRCPGSQKKHSPDCSKTEVSTARNARHVRSRRSRQAIRCLAETSTSSCKAQAKPQRFF